MKVVLILSAVIVGAMCWGEAEGGSGGQYGGGGRQQGRGGGQGGGGGQEDGQYGATFIDEPERVGYMARIPGAKSQYIMYRGGGGGGGGGRSGGHQSGGHGGGY